jgi:hypothetical protein
VTDFEKEKVLMKNQNEMYIKEQAEEIANFTEEINHKKSEVRKLRGLAKIIIQQRSDVE